MECGTEVFRIGTETGRVFFRPYLRNSVFGQNFPVFVLDFTRITNPSSHSSQSLSTLETAEDKAVCACVGNLVACVFIFVFSFFFPACVEFVSFSIFFSLFFIKHSAGV